MFSCRCASERGLLLGPLGKASVDNRPQPLERRLRPPACVCKCSQFLARESIALRWEQGLHRKKDGRLTGLIHSPQVVTEPLALPFARHLAKPSSKATRWKLWRGNGLLNRCPSFTICLRCYLGLGFHFPHQSWELVEVKSQYSAGQPLGQWGLLLSHSIVYVVGGQRRKKELGRSCQRGFDGGGWSKVDLGGRKRLGKAERHSSQGEQRGICILWGRDKS